jgi:putative endonuclease
MAEFIPPFGGVVNYKMWHVYILKSKKDNGYYIGCTSNLVRRIKEHNQGYNYSTKNRLPLVLVYTKEYFSRKEGFAREKQIKQYKGGKAFKRLIDSN